MTWQSAEESSESEKIAAESPQQEMSSQFQKICVVTSHCHRDTGVEGYAFCIIDVSSSNSIQSLKPLIELDSTDIPYAAIAVLGTKMYVFGGVDFEERRCKIFSEEWFDIPSPYWTSRMFIYDMKDSISSSSINSTIKLQTSSLLEGPYMYGRKREPVAVVIDDTRICVFALALYNEEWSCLIYPCCSPPNFELFDTKTMTWTKLPEPMDYHSKCPLGSNRAAFVHAYFTYQSTLIIFTYVGNVGSFFRINFDDATPQWEEIFEDVSGLSKSLKDIHGMILEDGSLCSPFEIVKRGDFLNPYPILFQNHKEREDLILYLPKGALTAEGSNVCIVRVGFEEGNNQDFCNLLLDIINFHPQPELVSHLSKRGQIHRAVKSFTFSVPYLFNHTIMEVGCFPIKDDDNRIVDWY